MLPKPFRCIVFALLSVPFTGIVHAKLPRDLLTSCDPAVALRAAEEILQSPPSLKEPTERFVPASVLFKHGRKDDGLFWLYAAQLRTRYQMVFEKRCQVGSGVVVP